MEIHGRVHNGVMVLEGEFPLPEGTEVIVSSGAAPETKPVGEQRIEFPLVRSSAGQSAIDRPMNAKIGGMSEEVNQPAKSVFPCEREAVGGATKQAIRSQ